MEVDDNLGRDDDHGGLVADVCDAVLATNIPRPNGRVVSEEAGGDGEEKKD